MEKTEELEETKIETYEEEIRCPNCGHKKFHEIPKGMRIADYKLNKKCTICGCNLSAWI